MYTHTHHERPPFIEMGVFHNDVFVEYATTMSSFLYLAIL